MSTPVNRTRVKPLDRGFIRHPPPWPAPGPGVPMRPFRKQDFPVEQARRFLEPGPIVLVSTAARGQRTIMTMGWHMVMGFSPSLLATYIWNENHSFALAR